MKKWFSILLCMVMLMTTLCAVSAQAEGTIEPCTISFWKSPHSNHEEEIWENVIKRFNEEYPQITVEFLSVPWDSVVEKEMAAFASGTASDVSFQVEQYMVYAQAGKLVDLNEYATPEKLAGYPQSALDYFTFDGKLCGIPFVALNSVVFYNKDLFAEAGVEIPTTWDELVAAAQKLTLDKDGDGVTDQWGLLLGNRPSIDQWVHVTYIVEAGGQIWNDTVDNIGFNNEAGIKGLEFVNDLYNTYKVCPGPDVYSSQEEQLNAFCDGKIAMYPAQIHTVNNIRTTNPDLNLGAFINPAGPAEDPAYATWDFANIGSLSISSDSPNKEAAWAFVEFATRPEVEKDFLSDVGFFSPQMATNDLMYQGDEIMTLAGQNIRQMRVSPASFVFQGMYDGLKTMFESVIRGVATPQEAMDNLEAQFKELADE